MKVKLGEWETWFKHDYRMELPIDLSMLQVKRSGAHWWAGFWIGFTSDESCNIIASQGGFETADEAKAFIISEYEKLVLSLIEVE